MNKSGHKTIKTTQNVDSLILLLDTKPIKIVINILHSCQIMCEIKRNRKFGKGVQLHTDDTVESP